MLVFTPFPYFIANQDKALKGHSLSHQLRTREVDSRLNVSWKIQSLVGVWWPCFLPRQALLFSDVALEQEQTQQPALHPPVSAIGT